MYFVIFESKTPESLTIISGEYYAKLQNLLKTQPGFISEVAFASPHTPDKGLLIARFVDGEAENEWRLQQDHLKIENDARRNIFYDYRLRVGNGLSADGKEAGSEGGSVTAKEGRCVVLYERPVVEGTATPPEDVRDFIDPAKRLSIDRTGAFVDSVVYQGEKTIVWISGWKSDTDAANFGKALKGIDGDSIQLVRIERDYGKYDRKEAPEDADEAQVASVSYQGKID